MIFIKPAITRALSWFFPVQAITLWPFIVAAAPMSAVTARHERIHLRQQRELLVLGFYFLYVWWYLVARIWDGLDAEAAYYAIPFEREAYAREKDPFYLAKRPFWGWLQHL